MTSSHYPRYRVLTGPDDDAFCFRVSEAIDLGYELHGGPAITAAGETVYVAQALYGEDKSQLPCGLVPIAETLAPTVPALYRGTSAGLVRGEHTANRTDRHLCSSNLGLRLGHLLQLGKRRLNARLGIRL